MPKQQTRKEKRAAKYKTEPEGISPGLKLETITPLTENQAIVAEDFEDGYNLVLYGYAGTGKTFLGLGLAAHAVVNKRLYNKIVIFRNVVPSRDMGFLPGSQKEKAQVYETPYVENFAKLFGRSDAYSILKTKKLVEFETTSFVRGITLDDCVIIIDELQNLSWKEIYSLLTRVGKNCRVIICGDIRQNDLVKEESGFHRLMQVSDRMDTFSHVEFTKEDIVRSDFAKDFIIACEDLNAAP